MNRNAFLEFLNRYNVNDWIYPNVLYRKFGRDVNTVNDIYKELSNLELNGFVKKCIRIYCSNCQQHSGKYRKLIEIPEEVYCENCDKELIVPWDSTEICYKVLKKIEN